MKRVMPAEWEEQDAIVIAWPNKETDWNDNLPEVIETYIQIVESIADHQLLIILSNNNEILNYFSKDYHSNIKIIDIKFNDTWTRDYIGISVKENGSSTLLDFKFNAWGNKFESKQDNSVNNQLIEKRIINYQNNTYNNFVLEGGAIECNGNGILLTTTKCLLNKNRNPTYKKSEIETTLIKALGVSKILWLNNGEIPGDDTDSHIDTLARFCNTNTIVYSKDNSKSLNLLESELKELAQKENFKLIPLPVPKIKEHNRPATYANFLITNKKVIVPTYNHECDKLAIDILQNIFPNRKVIGLNCNELIKQNGSLHCVTMQLHKGILNLSLL